MSSRKRDTVYKKPLNDLTDFTFDQQVVSVFEDMINRSVPGYANIVHNLISISALFVKPNTLCYDLGCSLGASTLAIRQGVDNNETKNVMIMSVDTSTDMLDRAQGYAENKHSNTQVQFLHNDIRNLAIENASLVVLNFTLQFLPLEDRNLLIKKIFNGMNEGACLVLSEKVSFEDSFIQDTTTSLHHQFKREQGYSDLEIAQKRDAIENIMKLETQQQHIQRLKETGFRHTNQWYQNTAFCSFIAFK